MLSIEEINLKGKLEEVEVSWFLDETILPLWVTCAHVCMPVPTIRQNTKKYSMQIRVCFLLYCSFSGEAASDCGIIIQSRSVSFFLMFFFDKGSLGMLDVWWTYSNSDDSTMLVG